MLCWVVVEDEVLLDLLVLGDVVDRMRCNIHSANSDILCTKLLVSLQRHIRQRLACCWNSLACCI